LREDHWLRVFENRVLKRILGPKRGWRIFYSEELDGPYFSQNIIWEIK
jgi:hypothetical protein